MNSVKLVPEGLALPHTIRHQVVRRDIMTRPDLTPSAQRVFAFFWQCTHQKKPMKFLFMREKIIAEETFLSVRSVRRALRVLEEAGLLITYHRPRRSAKSAADLTTNRYVLRWHPYEAKDPATEDSATSVESQPINMEYSHRPNDQTDELVETVPADVIFVTGGDRAGCPEGQDASRPESAVGRTLADSTDNPIQKPGFKTEIDQQNGTILWSFSTADALLLFLLLQLNPFGLSSHTLRQWAKQYSLERLAEVAQWVLSSPSGTIRNPGAWMRRALENSWAAPTWVREARARRLDKAHERQRAQAQERAALHEDQEREAIRAAQEREETLWTTLGPQLENDSDVLAHAQNIAREELGAAASALFRQGTVLWRQMILRAARDLNRLTMNQGVA